MPSSDKSGRGSALEETLPSGEFPVRDSAPVGSGARSAAERAVVEQSGAAQGSGAPTRFPRPERGAVASEAPAGARRSAAASVGLAIAAGIPAPGQSVGRFLVVKQLGAGAMGMVLAAYDPVLDRKVALKLLHQSVAGDSAGRQRLLREAQAMARLAHPNVVTVFEVGTVGDTVFLAMEHVDGTTLADWMASGPRRWRAVLATFLAAGRGLAAAHAAGVVHRDFKPENVLVAADGRVRVSDFGLASALPGNRLGASTAAIAPPLLDVSPSLTQAGSLIGTPLYMSPEQHRGAPADVRSDQFSFCVALYEGLYGHTPFVGEAYEAYADEVLAGRVRPAPRGADVPAWLRAVVLRGMATEPGARFPSMNALIDALGRDPAQRRRRIAAALGVAVLAGLAVYGLFGRGSAAAASPCAASDQASARSLAGAWDGAVRARVETAFRASRRPGAADSLARVEHALDERARAVAAMRRDACEATYVRREQSADLLDRRIDCLDGRVADMRGMTELLSRADDDVVDRSVEAVLSLGGIDSCADTRALLAAVPPPADPALRERVAAARESLADVNALVHAGKYRPALDAARSVASKAAALPYSPVQAEAMHRRAELEMVTSDLTAARGSFEAAMASAAAGHDDAMFARCLTQLYHVTGYGLHRMAEADALLPIARAAVARAGASAELRALLDGAVGSIAQAAGRYQEAADAFARALDATQGELGPDDFRVATALSNLGHATSSLGRYPDALATHRRALAIREEQLGPDHPQVAVSLAAVGGVLSDMAEHQEALAAFQRALAILEKSLGPDNPRVADILDSIGLVLADLDRKDEALEQHQRAQRLREKTLGPDHLDVADGEAKMGGLLHNMGRDEEAIVHDQRALAIREKQLGPEHPEIAGTLNNLALAVRKRDHRRARALLRRSLAIREKTMPPDHPDVATTVNNLALEEFESHHYADAVALYQRAVAIWEKSLGSSHPSTLVALYYMGRSELGAGSHRAAAATLERALAGYQTAGARAPQRHVPVVRAALADALWRSGNKADRKRAREQVATARGELLALGNKTDAAELKRWLATHRK